MLTRTRARKSFWKWRNFKKFFLLFQLLLPTALRPIVLHLPKLQLYRLRSTGQFLVRVITPWMQSCLAILCEHGDKSGTASR